MEIDLIGDLSNMIRNCCALAGFALNKKREMQNEKNKLLLSAREYFVAATTFSDFSNIDIVTQWFRLWLDIENSCFLHIGHRVSQ